MDNIAATLGKILALTGDDSFPKLRESRRTTATDENDRADLAEKRAHADTLARLKKVQIALFSLIQELEKDVHGVEILNHQVLARMPKYCSSPKLSPRPDFSIISLALKNPNLRGDLDGIARLKTRINKEA